MVLVIVDDGEAEHYEHINPADRVSMQINLTLITILIQNAIPFLL